MYIPSNMFIYMYILIYLGSARLISFEINLTSQETRRAEPGYINTQPANQRPRSVPACKKLVPFLYLGMQNKIYSTRTCKLLTLI